MENGRLQRASHLYPHATGILIKSTLLTAVVVLTACGGGSSGGSENSQVQTTGVCESFDCRKMLENLADNVVTPMIGAFNARVETLNVAVGAWQQSPQSPQLQTEARQAWNDAMLTWQSLELVQIGPLAENDSLLRDSIYAWPSVSACVVDQEVIEAAEQGVSYDISTRTPLRKGLPALEYILYAESLDHTCPSTTVKTTGWNSRSPEERLALRLDYAKAASAELVRLGTELKTRWSTGPQNFRNELVTAGAGSTAFSTAQKAVNAVSDALFYLEKEVKDIKLGEPLGLKGDKCQPGTQACAVLVENPLSARSKQHLRQNLLAFQQLFLGNSADGMQGLGFDDLIDSVSTGGNTSATMEADISEALNAVDALGELSLQAAVADENGYNLAKGIHESTKKITDRLKNEFLTVMGLAIPAAAAGDGD